MRAHRGILKNEMPAAPMGMPEVFSFFILFYFILFLNSP
jgi:hypothetical protein